MPKAIDGLDLSGGREHFGGYSYTAAAYVLGPGDLGPLADGLHDFLSGLPGTLASASAPSPGLCAVRILTAGAPVLYKALNGVRTILRDYFGLPGPAREVI